LRYESAVILAPPPSRWKSIQEIRSARDKSYLRWPPHVNLLYPFVVDDGDDGKFAAAAAMAADALRGATPFACAFDAFAFFEHNEHSATVWMHPSSRPMSGRGGASSDEAKQPGTPEDPPVCADVVRAQLLLETAFPFAHDQSSKTPGAPKHFTPHMSVGQWPAAAAAATAAAAFERDFRDAPPIEFDVDAVYFISRKGPDAPFEFRARVPLGGGDVEMIRDADRRDASDDDDDYFWRRPYRPKPPPEGARCLQPKPKRRRNRNRNRSGGRGGGRGGGDGETGTGRGGGDGETGTGRSGEG